MKARNLAEAKAIWLATKNTFGMNHMIASASDVKTANAPVFVMETMRDYTAWFVDKDAREDHVNFTDPKTKKSYRAGFAMKDAVWRTNHAYDPMINKFATSHP
jgi:predicted double-glycine peptidase